VQFTDDPALTETVGRAAEACIGELALRVLRADDVLHEKLRAGRDPTRRRSKRLQDVATPQSPWASVARSVASKTLPCADCGWSRPS